MSKHGVILYLKIIFFRYNAAIVVTNRPHTKRGNAVQIPLCKANHPPILVKDNRGLTFFLAEERDTKA